jgi:AraC-like DNA-binding protein
MSKEMRYEEIDTEKSLADFVRRFWKFTNPTEHIQHYTILPDGYFDLIIKITAEKLDSTTLFGLWTKEVDVVVPADTIIIGICFKPLAAEYVLQQVISDILNNSKKLSNDFWNIGNLRFDDLKVWTEQVSNQMLENLKMAKSVDERKQSLFNLLFHSNGSETVADLAKQIFWSSRQINRYFKTRFGLALKTYSSILRCASSYIDIREGDLFPKQDFYDQAHFIKEIKKYTGSSPKELHNNKNDRFLQFSTLPGA